MTRTPPTWRLTIDVTDVQITPGPAPNVWLVEGADPWPFLEGLAPDPVPPSPPVVPPPLPPPPPVDEGPWVWPPQPPQADHAEQRYADLGAGFYVGEPRFKNPLPGDHLYAGMIQNPDARVGGWTIGGWRLWAPMHAQPWLIRQVLRTGRV